MNNFSFKCFILYLLLGIFVVPAWAIVPHSCATDESNIEYNKNSYKSLQNVDADFAQSKNQEENKSTHNQDCNCPAHRAGCCHSHLFLNYDQQIIKTALSVSRKFSDFYAFTKPGPFLDGPFQPPRS